MWHSSTLACLTGSSWCGLVGCRSDWLVERLCNCEQHQEFEQRFAWLGGVWTYKQVPAPKESLKYAVLVATRPADQKPVYFLSQNLPFGACAAVYPFNRINRSLWHLSTYLCKTLGGVFYDDFRVLTCGRRPSRTQLALLLTPLSCCTAHPSSLEGMKWATAEPQ